MRGLMLMAVALLFPLRPALAGPYWNLGVQCTPGAFRTCASVLAWNEFNPATGEHNLFVRLTNMQGLPGYTDNTPGGGIASWELSNLLIKDCFANLWENGCDTSGDLHDRVMNYSSLSEWHAVLTGDDTARIGFSAYADSEAGIWGCDGPDENYFSPYAVGCGGSWTFRLALGQGAYVLLTENTFLSFSTYGRDSNNNYWSNSCSTDPTAATCLTSTVPEPVTIALLGTGLAAVGGIGGMRRRRKTEADEGVNP